MRGKVLAVCGALAGIAAIGVTAYASSTINVRPKVATTFSWDTVTHADNKLCNSSNLIKINEQLTGSSSGDPQETGTNKVHIEGLVDKTNGYGELKVTLEIRNGDEDVAHEEGYVVLTGGSGGNFANGLLSGDVDDVSVPNPSGPPTVYGDGKAYTNITARTTYDTTNPAFVISRLDGQMGGSASHNNAGAIVPNGAC